MLLGCGANHEGVSNTVVFDETLMPGIKKEKGTTEDIIANKIMLTKGLSRNFEDWQALLNFITESKKNC